MFPVYFAHLLQVLSNQDNREVSEPEHVAEVILTLPPQR